MIDFSGLGRIGIIPLLGLLLGLLSLSCGLHQLEDAEHLQSTDISNVKNLVDDLASQTGLTAQDRVVIIEQLVRKMQTEKHPEYIPPFLSNYVNRFPDDQYDTYYLYLIGVAYDGLAQAELAAVYFQRSLHSGADIIANGESVHYGSIQHLLQYQLDPIVRINLYTELLNRFADKGDPGSTYYFMARAYEEAGQYQKAFQTYAKFLQYPTTVIPGKVNEQQRIREMLNMADSPRNWTREDLNQLIAEIRTALANKDFEQLQRVQAKVNFFSMSWLQEKADFNSQVAYDLRRFLLGSEHIYTENNLEGNSNSQEAYLKSWGWSSYLPIWYLYMRRVNFPADPEINGNWEWVGIYFGELLQ